MKYRGVHITAYVEHMNYHEIDEKGFPTDNIVEYDHDPQMKCWDLFGNFIEDTTLLDLKDYPTLESVKQYILKKQYEIYSTYTREYDGDSDTGECYGVHFWDGDQIIDTFWFKTEEESEAMIDEFNSVNPGV